MVNPVTFKPREDTLEGRAAGNQALVEGQKRALELAVHGSPLREVLEVIVHTVEAQSANGVLGSILLLDAGAGRLHHGAAPSLPAAYNAAIDGIAIGPDVGSCGTAAFTGKTVVVSDIATDPLWANFKALALEHGLRACWSMPILSSTGEVLGTFALYHREPRVPTARDREVVELLGHTATLIIERERQKQREAAAEAAARAAREEQLARLGAMFEHAPAAIAVLRGPEHVFEVANPKYAALVGNRPVIGRRVRDAFPDLEGQGLFERLDEVRATGKPFVAHGRQVLLRRPDRDEADERFLDFVYQPMRGSGDAVEAILCVAYDVTEVVRARLEAETLRARAEASERDLRAFVDNLPALAWTARGDGVIDSYNRRWYEYTGTTLEEMQAAGWEKVYEPHVLPTIRERWTRSLETGEPFEMEFRLRGADGTWRWFLSRVAPSRDADGRVLRWFATNTNIDDIKAAQVLAVEMAAQSEETARALIELRAAKERAEARLRDVEGSATARR